MIKKQLIAIFTSFILIVTLSFQSHYVFAEEQENEEIIIEENIAEELIGEEKIGDEKIGDENIERACCHSGTVTQELS